MGGWVDGGLRRNKRRERRPWPSFEGVGGRPLVFGMDTSAVEKGEADRLDQRGLLGACVGGKDGLAWACGGRRQRQGCV